MLNLPIAMFQSLLILALIFHAQTAELSIISPLPGDTLRGQVEIVGNLNVPNFASAELAFSYASNPADSWFTIQTFPQPVADPTFAIWDTTTLTDGDYTLHLRVFFQDGSSQDVVIPDLKIRNDTPPPTAVLPTATATEEPFDMITINPQPLPSPSGAAAVEPEIVLPSYPSPTPLPVNPASVTVPSIYSNFAQGSLAVFVLFTFFGLILRLRRNR